MTAVLAPEPDSDQWRSAFRLLWFGEGVSVLGNATSAVLVPLLAVVELDAGAWWMGLLTAAAWLPWLVIGLPAGAVVDRLPARGVMIAADLVSAASLATVPLAWVLDALSLGQLLAVALINGTCTMFFRAAYPTLVTGVVPEHELTAANARMFGTESASNVAGPGVAGWLAGLLGAAVGLVVDAASFLVSAWCLWRLPRRPTRTVDEPGSATLRTRVAEGLRIVYADRLLRFFTVLGGISNFGLTGFQAILVLYLVRTVDLTPTEVGIVLAVDGIGGVLGAAVANKLTARLGSARALIVLQLVGGPTALLLALAAPGPLTLFTVLALPAVGFGVVGGNVIKAAFRMRYVPAELQARAVTATQIVNFGTMPLAGVAAGWLGTVFGLRATILVMAAIHALASLAILRSPVAGRRDLPRLAGSPG